MPAVARPRASDVRQYTSWDRARLSVVVPIAVIVAVAIVCIVVAVLSSAQRADVVAVDHENQLFSSALTKYGERVLREVESVASSSAALQNIRQSFDPEWARQRVGLSLESFFDHDYVFVFDRDDNLIYSQAGRRSTDLKWFAATRPGLASVIDYMRGRSPALHDAIHLSQLSLTEGGAHQQAAVIYRILGRPVVIAAVAVGPVEGIARSGDTTAPIIMSLKFIDDDALANIATQLGLNNLRKVDQGPQPAGDLAYDLTSPDGSVIARLSLGRRSTRVPKSCTTWCPSSQSRSPALRCSPRSSCYMRRTAAAIAAGELRLRHLAMHDRSAAYPIVSSSASGWRPSARLELELTESVLLGNVDSAEAAMLRLKMLGLRLALDDFG